MTRHSSHGDNGNMPARHCSIYLASIFLFSAAVLVAQTAPAKPAAKAGTTAHRRAVPHAAPCPAALPPPEVPAGLPPAVGPVKVQTSFALRYIDTLVGTGAEAVAGKSVSLHYSGWLASDGTKFDSSFDHPDQQPIQLTLGTGRVIPGWDQGIVGMKQGGKRRLFIPYPLAYGANGRPPRIPAKSDLIFDVELVDVSDAAPTSAAPPAFRPPPMRQPATAPAATPPAAPAAPALPAPPKPPQ